MRYSAIEAMELRPHLMRFMQLKGGRSMLWRIVMLLQGGQWLHQLAAEFKASL